MKDIINKDGEINTSNEAYALSINEIVPILAKNIKMLYEENNDLKKRLALLEKIILEK